MLFIETLSRWRNWSKNKRDKRTQANNSFFSLVSHTTLLSHFVSVHTHRRALSRLWPRRAACVFFIKHLNIYKSDLRPYSVSKGFSKRPWPSTANRSHTLSWEQAGLMMVRAGLPECGPRSESPAWKASGLIKSPLNNSSDTTGGHIKWLLIKDGHPLEWRHKSETANEEVPDGEEERSCLAVFSPSTVVNRQQLSKTPVACVASQQWHITSP